MHRFVYPLGTFYVVDDHVRLETDINHSVIAEPDDVAVYERLFTAASKAAVYGDEAKSVVRGILDELSHSDLSPITRCDRARTSPGHTPRDSPGRRPLPGPTRVDGRPND